MWLPRKMALLGMFTVVALVASACGGSDSPSDKVDANAKFSFSYGIAPTSLDPHLGASDYDLLYLTPAYDRLTSLDENGEPMPMLAEKWELSDDGTAFNIKLRPDVTFSDKQPVNAEAVKLNLERIIDTPRSSIAERLSALIGKINVTDDLNVTLELKGPGGALPQILSGRAGMLISPKAFKNPDLDQNPVGAGAFILKPELTKAGSSYVYERRDDYWDDKAYGFETLELKVQANDATRLNAVRSGQTSASFLRESQTEEAEKSGMTVIKNDRSLSLYSLSLNTKAAKFAESDVREAISLAIDRDAISEGVFAGLCSPAVQPFPKNYFAYSKSVEANSGKSYDPDRAKKLLNDANAVGMKFTALVPNITAYQSLAQVLQQQLKDVGIAMKLKGVDAAQAATEFVGGSADALVGSYAGGVDPSMYTATAYLPKGAMNPGGLSNSKIEALHLEAMKSADPSERSDSYDKLLSEVFELKPADQVICFRAGAAVSAKEVEGLEVNFAGPYEFRDVKIRK